MKWNGTECNGKKKGIHIFSKPIHAFSDLQMACEMEWNGTGQSDYLIPWICLMSFYHS